MIRFDVSVLVVMFQAENQESRKGFDIYSTIRGGTTVNVEGFATLQETGSSLVSFYSVALFSGRVTFRGAFSLQNQVIDIALPLNQRNRR